MRHTQRMPAIALRGEPLALWPAVSLLAGTLALIAWCLASF